jgi:flavin-dependent dehydrogenase
VKKLSSDVLIVGAGPAGLIAAISLAPLYSVIIIDEKSEPDTRVGESLAPASKRLFKDIGILDDFEMQEHIKYYYNKSIWESKFPIERDFLKDIDGYGWHLDRKKFESWLSVHAINRGAKLLRSTKFCFAKRKNQSWESQILDNSSKNEVNSRVIVDATGRKSIVSRDLGVKKSHIDKLVCGWVIVNCNNLALGVSYIEAVESGWWYTAPLPNNKRIISFHTDNDLKATNIAKSPTHLLSEMQKNKNLFNEIGTTITYDKIVYNGFTNANSAILSKSYGDGWLAVGDSAFSFDPLSAQGIFNAIYTGLLSAQEINDYLTLKTTSFIRYGDALSEIWKSYQVHLKNFYSIQPKWRDSPFWARRANL